jgi:UDP-N-acetylglucosamine 2-epimerase (non-hydrolysing)
MRDNTERPVTVEIGTNVLAGTNIENVKAAVDALVHGRHKSGTVPDLWDGSAAIRIVETLSRELA